MDLYLQKRSSLRDFLHLLFKHKMKIVFFFLAIVSGVTLATFLMQPTYEVTSRILVKVGRENLYLPTAATGSLNPVVTVNQEAQLNSEIEILKSRALAEQVIDLLRPEVIYKDLGEKGKGYLAAILTAKPTLQSPKDQALMRFQDNLNAEAVKKSNVIQITYKSKDRDMAAIVMNKLVSLYLDRHLDIHKNPESYTFFQEQSRLLEEKLGAAEDALKTFKEQHNLSSLNEQRSLLLQQDSALRTSLNQTESAIMEAQKRIEQVQRQMASVPKKIPQNEESSQDPNLVSSLQAKLMELEIREKELKTKYTDQSRLVVHIKDEISLVRQKLDQLESKRYEKRSSGVNVTYQRLEEVLLRDEAEIKAMSAKQKTMEAQRAACAAQLENLNRFELQMDHLSRDVDVHRQNYRLYLTKFEESRISNAMDKEKIANISLIEPAHPPLKAASPRVALNLGIGILLGLFGALGFAFSAEFLDDTLQRPEQVERILALPVLTSVPQLKERNG